MSCTIYLPETSIYLSPASPPEQHGPVLHLMSTIWARSHFIHWAVLTKRFSLLQQRRYDVSAESAMIPACLKSQGLRGEAKAIFHFNMIASTAQGLQSPRCELKTSLHPFQRCFSKKCFILTLGCVKMVGWPKYLAANCLAPVVFRDTRSRLTLLGGLVLKESDILCC